MAKMFEDRDRRDRREQDAAADTVDAMGLVDLCRLLDVPVGLAIGEAAAPRAEESGNGLKREMLELNQAYARIQDPGVRRTLLQLVKAAAG